MRHRAVEIEVEEFGNVIVCQRLVWQKSVWRIGQVLRVEQVLWERTSFPTCL